MKITYNWLQQYINIAYSAEELAEKLTMAGIEVDSIQSINTIPQGVVVGEILEKQPHPNADKLSICIVYDGQEKLQVICGAPNCEKGVKAPLAKIGTVLTDPKTGKKIKVKKTKLRGVESYGLLCSANELGINNDQSGIWEFSEEETTGKEVSDIYQGDVVYELEITSNRPDWTSSLGIAREVKAYSGYQIKYPEMQIPETTSQKQFPIDIKIENFEACPLYTGRVIKNVKVGESPEWLQNRLNSIGLKSINNIVDITNYVLFETGQPLHAFDLNKISDKEIIVRNSYGEKIKALDEKEYSLDNKDIVIADKEKVIAVGGVIGGENSNVTETTTDIFIESAYFNPSFVKQTSQKINLSTDSSYRFERGVDPGMVETASNRATKLILEYAGGDEISELSEVKKDDCIPKPHKILTYFNNLKKILGIDISDEKIINIFEGLNFKILERNKDYIEVLPPSYRLDVSREVDLAEELIRIYGLDNVPIKRVQAISGGSIKYDSYIEMEKARNQLISLGLTESITYTLINKENVLEKKCYSEDEILEVINPISSENNVLRPSLLFSILRTVKKNIDNKNNDFKLFEIGKTYNKAESIEEKYSCGIALTGRRHPELYSEEKNLKYDFYDIKGLLASWLNLRKLKDYSFTKINDPIFNSVKSLSITKNGHQIIKFGEVSNKFVQGFRLRNPLFIALIDLEAILTFKKPNLYYEPLPIYPTVTRDLAVIVDEKIKNAEIVDCIKKSGSALLENVEVFDIYRDSSLGEGKKSIAYTLTFRHPDRTLTDEEVNAAHQKIRKTLEKNLPLKLR